MSSTLLSKLRQEEQATAVRREVPSATTAEPSCFANNFSLAGCFGTLEKFSQLKYSSEYAPLATPVTVIRKPGPTLKCPFIPMAVCLSRKECVKENMRRAPTGSPSTCGQKPGRSKRRDRCHHLNP